MKQTDISQMFAVPFGDQADSTTITTIPQSKTAIGRASMALGFPKETFTPIAAGGVPPYGEDMNGILHMLAQAARAAEAGLVRPFSQTYANEINGYPLGAIVSHPSISGRFVMNTQDNNTAAPPGNGWVDPLSDFVTNEALSAYLGNYVSGNTINGSPYQYDWPVTNVGVNKASSTPWFYAPATGGYVDLASLAALQQETQRAQAAEAGLLPLAGGQMTGQITTNIGGTVPQVLGMSGRIVVQAFTASGTGWPANVTFPNPFAAGTTPIVSATVNAEPAFGGQPYGVSRYVCLTNINSNANTTTVTNTGFGAQIIDTITWSGGSVQVTTSGGQWTLNVIAIGVV